MPTTIEDLFDSYDDAYDDYGDFTDVEDDPADRIVRYRPWLLRRYHVRLQLWLTDERTAGSE